MVSKKVVGKFVRLRCLLQQMVCSRLAKRKLLVGLSRKLSENLEIGLGIDRLLNFSVEVKLKFLPLVLQSNMMARSDIEIGALSFRMG